MKQGEAVLGKDYFRELLETVRSIRASERRIWQQITDVFAEISFDYDKTQILPRSFMPQYKTSFITRLQGKQQLKLFTTAPIKTKSIWDLLPGRTHLTGESYSQML